MRAPRICLFVLSLCLPLLAQASPISWNELLVKTENTPSSEVIDASQLAAQEFQRVDDSHEVYSWEVAGPHDRTPHYCFEECACLAGHFSQVFTAHEIASRTLVLRGGTGMFGIDVQTKFGNQWYMYHVATLVEDKGTWWVIDPVVLGSTKPVSLREWKMHFEKADTLQLDLQ